MGVGTTEAAAETGVAHVLTGVSVGGEGDPCRTRGGGASCCSMGSGPCGLGTAWGWFRERSGGGTAVGTE